MGNHYGTVRCGTCYQRGHNKRSCPAELKLLEDRFARYNAGDTEYDHRRALRTAGQIAKRTGTNPLTGEKLVKRGPTRRCSYCKYRYGTGSEGLGHTRRTCKELKEDLAKTVKSNAAYRAGLLGHLRKMGIGKGAMVQMNVHGYWPVKGGEPGETTWEGRDVPLLILKVQWDRITHMSARTKAFTAQRVDKLGTTQGYESLDMPAFFAEDGKQYRVNGEGVIQTESGARIGDQYNDPSPDKISARSSWSPTLVGTVSADSINPPSDWLNGESPVINESFNDRKG